MILAFAAAACLYLSARVRNVAQRVVYANSTDSEASALRAMPASTSAFGYQSSQRELKQQAQRLVTLHHAILYGGSSLDLVSALERSRDQESLWFGSGCMRFDQSTCLPVR